MSPRADHPPVAATQAMRTALAEGDKAQEAVAACHQQAEELLVSARKMVRKIKNRTVRRITTIHRSRAKKLKKEVERILHAEEAIQTEGEERENLVDQRLDRAVGQLAAMLTGGLGVMESTQKEQE